MARRLAPGLLLSLLLAAAAGAPYACAAGPGGSPSDATLQQLSRHAGFIFRGRVLSVDQPKPAPGRLTTVRITFDVLEGIRGVRTGERLTIQEWAGLWGSGRPRYRVGQELLLFLYPLSRMGLTSPVGGDLGVFPVDAQGQIPALPPLIGLPGERMPKLVRPVPRVPYRQFSERVRRVLGD